MAALHPYAFLRDGVVIARLMADGQFASNADGAGWYEYDSVGDFLADMGVDPDPINLVSQLAGVVQGVPQLDMSALVPAAVVAPVVVPEVKPKRGRAKGGDTSKLTVSANVAANVAHTAPMPIPVSIDTAAQPVAQSTLYTDPLSDPAVQEFLRSQRAAQALTPPIPVPSVPTVAAPVEVAPAPAPALSPAPTPIPTNTGTELSGMMSAPLRAALTMRETVRTAGLTNTANRLEAVCFHLQQAMTTAAEL